MDDGSVDGSVKIIKEPHVWVMRIESPDSHKIDVTFLESKEDRDCLEAQLKLMYKFDCKTMLGDMYEVNFNDKLYTVLVPSYSVPRSFYEPYDKSFTSNKYPELVAHLTQWKG